MSATEAPRPSDHKVLPWLFAHVPGAPELDPTTIGKWLIYVSAADVDEVWTKIARAVEARRLGPSAKVATAVNASPGRDRRSLCIYTYDWQDTDDVRRVLTELRGLGFGGVLTYKTDANTLAAVYGPGSAIYVSKTGDTLEVKAEAVERATVNMRRMAMRRDNLRPPPLPHRDDGEILQCSERVPDTSRRGSHECTLKAKWWVSETSGNEAKAVCGVHVRWYREWGRVWGEIDAG